MMKLNQLVVQYLSRRFKRLKKISADYQSAHALLYDVIDLFRCVLFQLRQNPRTVANFAQRRIVKCEVSIAYL